MLLKHTLSRETAPTYTYYTYKWIVAVDGQAVTVKAQELSSIEGAAWVANGPAYEAFAMKVPLAEPIDPTREAIEFDAQTFSCFRLEKTGRDREKVITWTSYDVPVLFGLYTTVRQVTQDPAGSEVERHELIRYGGSGGGEHVRRPKGGH